MALLGGQLVPAVRLAKVLGSTLAVDVPAAEVVLRIGVASLSGLAKFAYCRHFVGAAVCLSLSLEPVAAGQQEDIAANLADLVAEFSDDFRSGHTPPINAVGIPENPCSPAATMTAVLLLASTTPRNSHRSRRVWLGHLADHRPGGSQSNGASADAHQQPTASTRRHAASFFLSMHANLGGVRMRIKQDWRALRTPARAPTISSSWHKKGDGWRSTSEFNQDSGPSSEPFHRP